MKPDSPGRCLDAPVADWPEKLVLGRYAQRFANGIDFSVLRYLTNQDLEKIGVLLGQPRRTRQKGLRTIAAWLNRSGDPHWAPQVRRQVQWASAFGLIEPRRAQALPTLVAWVETQVRRQVQWASAFGLIEPRRGKALPKLVG
jgi:SAM domain (Sterile alpha motif)